MAVIKTNFISLQYGIENAAGTAIDNNRWYELEPNGISRFGPEITVTPRSPISKKRQQRKGKTTDLDSGMEWEGDLTIGHLRDFAEGFMFATWAGPASIRSPLDPTLAASDAAITTVDGFTHANLANAIPINALIQSKGFPIAANNGRFQVATGSVIGITPITTIALVNETPAATTNARMEVIGHTFTDLVWTDATTTIGSAATDLTTLGLVVGQSIYIGGASARFPTGTAFGRIVSITTTNIVLDKVENDLAGTAGLKGGGDVVATAVDVLFGQFVRNLSTDNTSFLERFFRFEAGFPNLEAVGTDAYWYANHNICNSMTWNIGLADKATATFNFIGTDTPVPTITREGGASTPVVQIETDSFNTSSELVRLRVEKADETGLTTDFKNLTFTINNQASPEKVLGTLGAKFLNTGNLLIQMEGEIVFTERLVQDAIRNNDTVQMDFVLKNSDAGIRVDVPSMTLGNGAPSFPINESVLVSLSGEAFEDATLGTSLSISLFPFLPLT